MRSGYHPGRLKGEEGCRKEFGEEHKPFDNNLSSWDVKQVSDWLTILLCSGSLHQVVYFSAVSYMLLMEHCPILLMDVHLVTNQKTCINRNLPM